MVTSTEIMSQERLNRYIKEAASRQLMKTGLGLKAVTFPRETGE